MWVLCFQIWIELVGNIWIEDPPAFAYGASFLPWSLFARPTVPHRKPTANTCSQNRIHTCGSISSFCHQQMSLSLSHKGIIGSLAINFQVSRPPIVTRVVGFQTTAHVAPPLFLRSNCLPPVKTHHDCVSMFYRFSNMCHYITMFTQFLFLLLSDDQILKG